MLAYGYCRYSSHMQDEKSIEQQKMEREVISSFIIINQSINCIKREIDTNIEEVFIFTGDKCMYIIPKEEIKNRTTLNICEKYIKYRVDF